ncbi:MAG TPA: aspartyl protease family protein [Candidatus Acidoferrales bacterium]|nr:aspartyl protease family protein [Candidatus Acidoferrales bacterium]
MRNQGLIFAGLLTLCCCAHVFAAAAPKHVVSDAKTVFTLPFDLVDNRVFVEVRLNSRGPFHFLLDTGAGGVTVSADVAQQLGLQVGDTGQGWGVGEKAVRAGQAQIAQLQIGDLAFADMEASVMDLSDAPQVFGTKPFDGIIGLPVFERMVVKHDYVNRVLTFTAPDKFDYAGAGVIVHFERPRQIPVVAASLDGVAGDFGVDTGARSSLLLYGPFCVQNNLQEKYGAKLEGVTGWGIGGPVRSLLARAGTLQIGEVTVRDLVIRLSAQKTGLTTSSAMAGLIGPDVLSQFDVTFDYSRTRIIFEKNKDYGRRDSYDRAGIWMGQARDGKHFTVVDVIAGGPGAAAGVKPGDQILAINGENTANLILPDERESIRREPVGDKLTLLLESGGKRRTAVVALKDLV